MSKSFGSKNYKNLKAKTAGPLTVTKEDKSAIKDIYTCINKDVISVKDIEESTGLSYDLSCKIIREIKATSDCLCIQGAVHRVDYYMFISNHFKVNESDQDNADSVN